MSKPSLCLQTIYFHRSDREAAAQLGIELYGLLTRPVDDPLGYGAGIPVSVAVQAESVDLSAAERVVLLPVLGKTSFHLHVDEVLAQLRKWHAWVTEQGQGALLPVPTSVNWRSAEKRLPVKQFLSELYEADDPRQKTLDEIVLAVSRGHWGGTLGTPILLARPW